jgi:hypothetical protein
LRVNTFLISMCHQAVENSSHKAKPCRYHGRQSRALGLQVISVADFACGQAAAGHLLV